MRDNSFYKIDSYKKINIIFVILIIFIFFYAFLTPYLKITFASSCEGLPLIYCKSRGLTRAFSQIVRLNFDAALQFNPYSLQIAFFFVMQLISRVLINFIIKPANYSKVLLLDIVFSIFCFLFSFHNLVFI